MKKLIITIETEWLKLRRSRIPYIAIIFFIFIPAMMSLIFLIQKHPELASKLGMIGTKASLAQLGNGDWTTYFGFLTQVMAGIGLVGFSFLCCWIFGREFTEKTAKDIMALPVSRTLIVFSKYIVIALLCTILIIVFYCSGIVFGKLIGISDWQNTLMLQSTKVYLSTSFLTLFLMTPVGFLSGYSRGYLLPMGFAILTLIMSNFVGLVGLGTYFPWAIPGLLSVPAGTEGVELTYKSYIILVTTFIVGLEGTILWWKKADQH